MDGVGGLEGWRWIFILEGIVTIVCSTVAVWVLPANVASARFFTLEEREFAGQLTTFLSVIMKLLIYKH